MAYFQLKKNWSVSNASDQTNADNLKRQLIKRLTDKGYNLQKMAIKCLKDLLADSRSGNERSRYEERMRLLEVHRYQELQMRNFLERMTKTDCNNTMMAYYQLKQRWQMGNASDQTN